MTPAPDRSNRNRREQIAELSAQLDRSEARSQAQARILELEAELTERTQITLLFTDILRHLNRSHAGLPEMLNACCQSIVKHLEVAFARIWTLNEEEQVLELQASAGLYIHLDGPHARVPVGKYKIGLIALEKEAHLTNNVVNDPKVSDKEWARREGMVSFAGHPLLLGERLVGVIAMFARHQLSKTVLDALLLVSEVVALGIERSNEQHRLEESEQHNRTIVEAALEAIITVDPSGSILEFNPAAERMFGYARAYALGRKALDLIATPGWGLSDFGSGADRSHGNALIGQRLELTAMRLSGHEFPIELIVVPATSGAADVFICLIRDISARKEAERRVSEFYSTISHELRTPLTSIRGSLGLVAGGVVGTLNPEMLEMIEMAVTNCDRLIRLINDILDLRKIEAGKLELRQIPIDAGIIVDRAVKEMYGLSLSLNIDITANVRCSSQLYADPDRIIQILCNLISNAVKFSDGGSHVYVTVDTVAGNRVRFAVVDEGTGIDSADLERLFAAFQQLDSSDSRLRQGSGLGLAISKALVEQHGGTIGVESLPGKGSTFWFELPGCSETPG